MIVTDEEYTLLTAALREAIGAAKERRDFDRTRKLQQLLDRIEDEYRKRHP